MAARRRPAAPPRRALGALARALVAGLPPLALGYALALLVAAGYRPPGGPFAQFATLDWYREYLGARMPFRPALAPLAPLDARWGDWRPAYAAYATTGVAPDFPRGRALLWRWAALLLPVALALYALGCLQLAVWWAAGPALAGRVAARARPLARALATFAALAPWAWALFYLAAVRALLPPTGDGPALAAYRLLGPANPALTKRHDLRMWAVVGVAAALWAAAAALLLPLARRAWGAGRPPPSGTG